MVLEVFVFESEGGGYCLLVWVVGDEGRVVCWGGGVGDYCGEIGWVIEGCGDCFWLVLFFG